MKKVNLVSTVLVILVLVLGFWILEPFQNNPFLSIQNYQSRSEIKFSENAGHQIISRLQSKADSILQNAMLLNDFMGVSAGVYAKDIATWVGQSGLRSKRHVLDYDKNTVHRIASISKPMTATAIMQLVEKGKIELDAPIEKYIPSWNHDEKGKITIRQLLNHTSGIRHYRSTWDGISFSHFENLEHALEAFSADPLIFQPGTGYLYSSYGYTVLGAIIESVTDQKYQEYMLENIWKPSGMNHTSLEERAHNHENKAELYLKIGSTFVKSPKTDLSIKYPGGGIQSTAYDLLQFGKALLENLLIDSTSLHQMTTISDTLKEGSSYGMGWFVINHPSYGKIIRHGGSQSGTSSYLQIFLDQKVISTSIANNFGSDNEVYFLSRDLSQLMLDSTSISSRIHYFHPQPRAVLKKYVGMYENGKQKIEIVLKNGILHFRSLPHSFVPVFSKSSNEFFSRYFDGQLKFEDDSHGNGLAVVYTYEGIPQSFQKVH